MSVFKSFPITPRGLFLALLQSLEVGQEAA
jgi:hypothetical protein